MKRKKLSGLLALVLSVVLLAIPAANVAAATSFVDVKGDEWFAGYLDGQYFDGYDDGSFRPYNAVNRAQAAKIIVLASDKKLDAQDWSLYYNYRTRFSDVAPLEPSGFENWVYEYVSAAKYYGIVGGYSDNTYRPYNNVTRAQIAKMIVNAWDLEEGSLAVNFTDIGGFDAETQEAIAILASNGIVKGYNNGASYKPNAAVNRAQFAKIIYLVIEKTDAYSTIDSYDATKYLVNADAFEEAIEDAKLAVATADNSADITKALDDLEEAINEIKRDKVEVADLQTKFTELKNVSEIAAMTEAAELVAEKTKIAAVRDRNTELLAILTEELKPALNAQLEQMAEYLTLKEKAVAEKEDYLAREELETLVQATYTTNKYTTLNADQIADMQVALAKARAAYEALSDANKAHAEVITLEAKLTEREGYADERQARLAVQEAIDYTADFAVTTPTPGQLVVAQEHHDAAKAFVDVLTDAAVKAELNGYLAAVQLLIDG